MSKGKKGKSHISIKILGRKNIKFPKFTLSRPGGHVGAMNIGVRLIRF